MGTKRYQSFADAFGGQPPLSDDRQPDYSHYVPPIEFPYQLGERVICDMHSLIHNRRDGQQHDRRPVYVYGYLVSGDAVVAVMAYTATTQLPDKEYEHQKLIVDVQPGIMPHPADKTVYFPMRQLYIIPYEDAYFGNAISTGIVAAPLMASMIAKRVDALLNAVGHRLNGVIPKRDDLAYHGVILKELTMDVIRSTDRAIDVVDPYYPLPFKQEALLPPDLTQEDVDTITRWTAWKTQTLRGNGRDDFLNPHTWPHWTYYADTPRALAATLRHSGPVSQRLQGLRSDALQTAPAGDKLRL